jgi:hypothetical protein
MDGQQSHVQFILLTADAPDQHSLTPQSMTDTSHQTLSDDLFLHQ